MEKFKRICTKLLFPHPVLVALLSVAAGALLIYAFAVPGANEVVTYVSYFLSAYALTLVCVRAPAIFRAIKSFKEENKYMVRYRTDAQLRLKISLYSSVALNLLHALMQVLSGLQFHSVWFYALASYYVLLALMRYFLLKETVQRKRKKTVFMEYLHYRFCGILLVPMNLVLGTIVFYIVWQDRGFSYHYIQTIAMAAVTFASMAMAVVNVVKYRKNESPVKSAATVISLASALVSMLSLETAMLSAFGEENTPQFRRIITLLTGIAVCLLVLGMAVYMIVRGTKEIKRIKKEKQYEQ